MGKVSKAIDDPNKETEIVLSSFKEYSEANLRKCEGLWNEKKKISEGLLEVNFWMLKRWFHHHKL